MSVSFEFARAGSGQVIPSSCASLDATCDGACDLLAYLDAPCAPPVVSISGEAPDATAHVTLTAIQSRLPVVLLGHMRVDAIFARRLPGFPAYDDGPGAKESACLDRALASEAAASSDLQTLQRSSAAVLHAVP